MRRLQDLGFVDRAGFHYSTSTSAVAVAAGAPSISLLDSCASRFKTVEGARTALGDLVAGARRAIANPSPFEVLSEVEMTGLGDESFAFFNFLEPPIFSGVTIWFRVGNMVNQVSLDGAGSKPELLPRAIAIARLQLSKYGAR